MARVRIVPIEGNHYSVFIDDIDVSKYVRGLSFSLSVDHPPSVVLELAAGIDIPEDIKAAVTMVEMDAEKGDQ